MVPAILFMSLAWPLRGQFGHLHGAMIPGAFAAAFVALAHPEARWRSAFGRALLWGVVGFAAGGHLSYGALIEETLRAPSLPEAAPGLMTFGGLGAVWGGLGLTCLGFGFAEHTLGSREVGLLAALVCCWVILLGVLNWEQADLVLFGLGLAVLHLYNLVAFRSRIVATFGAWGVCGFGLGFLGAIGLLYAGHHGWLGSGWPWWQLRDQFIGLCGGLALVGAHRMAVRQALVPALSPPASLAGAVGLICFTVAVPAVNVLDVLASWTRERPIVSSAAAPFIQALIGLASLGASVALIHWWRQARTSDQASEYLLRLVTVVVVWLLCGLAIAKETIPLGLSRWEPAFSLFLMCALILTGLLLAGRARPQRR